MRRNRFLEPLLVLGLVTLLPAAGCGKAEAPPPQAVKAPGTTPAGGGKIPITTASAEARAEFLKGRENAEKLQITDSIAHFQKAVSLDPGFAQAELSLANASPTGKEFFEHLQKAAGLADQASNGEKLMILAAQAGANNDPAKQKEHLEALVAAYPGDERAHLALGGWYFGQQQYPQAIEQYRKATEIEPGFAPAWNILGYSLRQNGDFAGAEKAFQKYIELIPKDPNPYDSYAELLLKMGRFDDSIAQYRKALEIEPTFLNAHQGIAMDLLYSGKPAEAEAEIGNIAKKARTDAERRTGLVALTVVHVDGGKTAKALEDADRSYELGQKTTDVPGMAGAVLLKGNILLEAGKPDQARAEFERAVKLIEGSGLSPEVKATAALVTHFNLGRVAAAKKDLKTAKSEADEFRKGAEAKKNPAQIRNAHELDGIIALAEKDDDKAIAELLQASQQNPQNFWRLSLAYKEKGDTAKAREYREKAANFNSLPQLNYAFIRSKAKAA
jgi:tetratricopeptide (TPR) repeat protein